MAKSSILPDHLTDVDQINIYFSSTQNMSDSVTNDLSFHFYWLTYITLSQSVFSTYWKDDLLLPLPKQDNTKY